MKDETIDLIKKIEKLVNTNNRIIKNTEISSSGHLDTLNVEIAITDKNKKLELKNGKLYVMKNE